MQAIGKEHDHSIVPISATADEIISPIQTLVDINSIVICQRQ